MEYLLSKEQEIIDLCTLFNARALIRLQPSSYEESALKTLINLAAVIHQKKFNVVKNQYSRAIEVSKVGKPKWILDVDDVDLEVDTTLLKDSLIAKIPSKNGYHLITNPFDSRDFQIKYLKSIEIHRNNPTNLFIP